MKIKTPTEFIPFSDGVCNIYTIDDNESKTYKYENLGFTNRVLGFKRFFEAQGNKMAISKVIRIPQLNNIDTYDHVEIGSEVYDIKIVQKMHDTNPVSLDLTLQLQ
ncbi:hypothetical protein ACJDU8_15750 [Clostridium sp. WILCCON 0269]|uniref:Phage head-tail adapter protein n=1 Tax=Candidatus Clostridium eludens TaxID=3381663 RepID=A0ABW8SP68_9CLOT